MQPTRLQTGIWLCCRCPVEVNQVAIRWRLGAEFKRAILKLSGETLKFLFADHPPQTETWLRHVWAGCYQNGRSALAVSQNQTLTGRLLGSSVTPISSRPQRMGVNMKHVVQFASIPLILLFAGASTFVRTSERMPTSSTEHSSPASPANLQGTPESQAPTASTTEPNKALVLTWSDALRNKDMATAQALVTDDWVIHGAGSNFARGPEGLKQWQGYIETMWANPHWTENDIFAEGDKVVRRITVYRTWRSNNKESAMTVVFVYRIADGKIAEVWRAADGLSSYQQIGAQIIMPGTNEDAGQATSLPARPGKIAEEKSSSEQETSQSNKVVGNTDTDKRESPSAVTTESNKALVARWADAIWNKDLSAAQALVTNDWVIHEAGSSYPKGPKGVKQWQGAVDSNWSYGGSTTDDVIAEGDKVARRTTVFAMYKPNHRSTVTPIIFIYRVADGRIAEVWRVANYVSTYMQAGARIIMPGAKPEAGQAASAKSQAEQEVLKAKQEFDEAALHNDADGRARFYADDYAIVYNDGTLGDKGKQLERVRSGRLRYSARTAEDVVVRVYGDTALIVERRKQSATFDGRPRPSDVRASEVWVKHEREWRLVSTQITPVLEPISGPLLQGGAARQPPEASKSAIEPVGTETAPEIAGGTSQAQQEILKALQEASEATPRNDADAVARILSDDSLVVIYNGALQWGKDSQVESLRSGFMKFSAATVQDVRVRLYGDSAVVIKRRKQIATVGGRTRPGDVRMTNLWVKRQDRWQEVFIQVTPILEPAPAQTGTGNARALGQAEQQTREAEQQIRKLEEERRQAVLHSDTKTLDQIYADGMTIIDIGGNYHTNSNKASVNLNVPGTRTTKSWVSGEMLVRVYGDTAIVTQRAQIADVLGSESRSFTARLTHVWVKLDGQWRLVARHGTRIAEPGTADSAEPVLSPAAIPQSHGAQASQSSAHSQSEREVLALEEQMEALQRSDSQARVALWSEDLIYIGNNGVAHDKTSLAKAVSAGEVKTEFLDVADRRVRVYDDAAVVTAMEHRKASFHGKQPRDLVLRYMRVWIKREGKWQVVAFQETSAEIRNEARPEPASAAQSLQVKHIRANGTELAYVEKGEGEPIILVHGLVSDYRTWNNQMDEFAKHFHVIAYSRRYHYPNSGTGDASDYTVDLHVRDLAAVIKALNLGPVHLIGHSYGGRVATLVAIAHPERVRSLVVAETGFTSLLKPKPEWQQAAENQKKVYEAVSEATRTGGAEAGVKMLFEFGGKTGAFDQLPAEQRQRYLDNARTLVPAWREQVQSTSNFACADASQIKAPVLWIESDSASRTTQLVGEEFARCKPQLERITIPHSEHGMMQDNAAAFNQAVLAFLQKALPPATIFVESAAKTPTNPERTSSSEDEAAIRKMVADVQDAWNRRDPQGMAAAAHLTKDYDHINVGGKWGSGKDQAEKNVSDFFATRGSTVPTVAQSIEKLRFITPDVAISVVRHRYSNDQRTWEALSTSVLHKMNGEWWNEAFQNTLIQSREEAVAQAARASSRMAQTEPEVITPANSKTDFSGDVAAIRKRVADGVDAWNRRDAKALAAHVSEDHDQIGVAGGWGSGRAQFEKALTAALATTRNNMTSSIAKIRFLTPEVAVVIVRREYTNDKETLKAISTSVLHKINGEWWNEAFQNTYMQPR
jgi:non-heme chloroperoxidase